MIGRLVVTGLIAAASSIFTPSKPVASPLIARLEGGTAKFLLMAKDTYAISKILIDGIGIFCGTGIINGFQR